MKFLDIKEKLLDALKIRLKKTPIECEERFTLIDGFMMLPLNHELSKHIVTGGMAVPIIGIVGNTSGRIYLFALKPLLPDVDLDNMEMLSSLPKA